MVGRGMIAERGAQWMKERIPPSGTCGPSRAGQTQGESSSGASAARGRARARVARHDPIAMPTSQK
jgi:hypothetical protein